jgi:nitrogen fixation protein FixH
VIRRVVLVVAVLAAAAVAVWLAWPAPTGPTVLTGSAGQHTVRLSVDSPRTGRAAFDVQVTDPGGGPAAVSGVTVEPVMPQMGHAQAPLTATSDGPGRYRVADVLLPMSGQWEITVALTGPAGPEQVVFPLLVR